MCGTFRNLIHGVGKGTGIRITLVYCQHTRCLERGVFCDNRHLAGAKRSKSDAGKGQEDVPRIEGLSL